MPDYMLFNEIDSLLEELSPAHIKEVVSILTENDSSTTLEQQNLDKRISNITNNKFAEQLKNKLIFIQSKLNDVGLSKVVVAAFIISQGTHAVEYTSEKIVDNTIDSFVKNETSKKEVEDTCQKIINNYYINTDSNNKE